MYKIYAFYTSIKTYHINSCCNTDMLVFKFKSVTIYSSLAKTKKFFLIVMYYTGQSLMTLVINFHWHMVGENPLPLDTGIEWHPIYHSLPPSGFPWYPFIPHNKRKDKQLGEKYDDCLYQELNPGLQICSYKCYSLHQTHYIYWSRAVNARR